MWEATESGKNAQRQARRFLLSWASLGCNRVVLFQMLSFLYFYPVQKEQANLRNAKWYYCVIPQPHLCLG